MTATPGLLPYCPEVEDVERESGLVGIDDPGPVFEVLSSSTARTILGSLYRNPGPASDVATRVGTSLQNATYHLNRLQNADLVGVVDTWYSTKGREMNVYAPANDPLVLFAGGSESKRTVVQIIDDHEWAN